MRITLRLGLAILSLLSALFLGASLADQADGNLSAAANSTGEKMNSTADEITNASNSTDKAPDAANLIVGDADRPGDSPDASASACAGVSVGIPEVHPPKRATFVINSAATYVSNKSSMDQSTLNAVFLKYRVDGTPHGYLTYYG